MDDPGTFHQDLEALGYRAVQDRGAGVVQYSLAQTRHLTYWVHWDTRAQTVLFTWELAIGEMVSELGMQIGSHEPLNQFMFPAHDARGPQEIAFVAQEMDRVEQLLRSISFLAD